MICPKCNARNPDGARFCNECAWQLPRVPTTGAAEPSAGDDQATVDLSPAGSDPDATTIREAPPGGPGARDVTGAASTGASGGGACPVCGEVNSDGARFCKGCGSALTRACPECGVPGSLHKRFCHQCGTDPAVFTQAQDLLGRMRAGVAGKNWGEVTREYGLLPRDPRLPGARGKAVLTQLAELNAHAAGKLEECRDLRARIEAAAQAEELESAVRLAETLLGLAPADVWAQAQCRELPARIDGQAFRRATTRAAGAIGIGDLAAARAAVTAYLDAYPTGAHVAEARRLLALDLTVLARLDEFRQCLTARRYGPALAAVEHLRALISADASRRPDADGEAGAQAGPAPGLPGLGAGSSLSTILAEVDAGCRRIAELARQADELEHRATSAQRADRSIEAATLWREVEALYPGRTTVARALAEIAAASEQARVAFAEFRQRLAVAVSCLDEKKLRSCRESMADLERLVDQSRPPDDVDWREAWDKARTTLAELRQALESTEAQVAEIAQQAATALQQQQYGHCLERVEAAAALTVELPDAAVARGQSAVERRDWGAAESAFAEALAVDGYAEDQSAKAAQAQARLGRSLSAAQTAYEQALASPGVTGMLKAETAEQRLGLLDEYGGAPWTEAKQALTDARQLEHESKWAEAADRWLAATGKVPEAASTAAMASRRSQYMAALARGTSALQGRDWATAEAAFSEALAVEGYADDEVAKAKRSEARQAQAQASRQGQYAAAIARGRSAFGAGDWSGAESGFSAALAVEGYGDDGAAKAGRAEARLAQALAAARAAKDRAEWETVLKSVQAAEPWLSALPTPRSATTQAAVEALQALAAEAKSQLEPRLRVVAVADGHEVEGAEVRVAAEPGTPTASSSQVLTGRTPCLLNVVRGQVYTVTVTAPAGGSKRFAPFSQAWVADYTGPRELRATLVALAEPPLPADLVAVSDAPFPGLEGLASGSAEALEAQKRAGAELGLPLEVKSARTGIAFRLVPGGMFTMGSPASEKGRSSDEVQHEVTRPQPFWCGKFEVTQGQWQQVMGSNPSWFRGKDAAAPVEQVSWNECQEFVRKLCEVEGVAPGTYRLLTEAEWEYACRAGTGDASAGDLDAMAWYARNSRKATHPVGGKQPNAWGLHDMHGNVWEWCEDRKGGGKPSQAPASGGAGPEALSRRGPGGSPGNASRRGGGWGSLANGCRSAGRGWHAVDVRGHDVGLRLGRTVP